MENSINSGILQSYLINTYAMLLKAQVYHWNVTGQNFGELHKLFEEMYEDLFEAVDEIAEQIRTYGVLVPGSFSIFGKDVKSNLNENSETYSSSEMVTDLVDACDTLLSMGKEILADETFDKDLALEDLLTTRAKSLTKFRWMLSSSKN